MRASSPSCRNTDPKAVVSGLFLRNNFAGPRYEDGQLQSWWLVDLGPGHRLIINYYTLRHDGSQDFLRNWVLEVGCARAQHASLFWQCAPGAGAMCDRCCQRSPVQARSVPEIIPGAGAMYGCSCQQHLCRQTACLDLPGGRAA